MNEPTHTCTTCKGKGTYYATGFWDGEKNGRRTYGIFSDDQTCHRCDGTGQVSAQRLEWERFGKEIALRRRARRETQRTMTQRLGLQSLAEYAEMESGRKDPAPLLALGL
jgi:hypothetical protein